MDELRSALRKLAKAVVVVTARADDMRFAMSATAVSEVSFDPPTMLVCVNRNNAIHGALRSTSNFCLNILAETQQNIAANCGGGRKGDDRFSEGDWVETATGVPRLIGAEACIECRTIECVSVGTHDIFIGEVTGVHTSEGAAPLIYMNGGYGFFTAAATDC